MNFAISFLDRTHQRFILAAFRPQDLLFHDGNVDHMKVIVVHVLLQRVGHGAVALVGVHDRRKDILPAVEKGILFQSTGGDDPILFLLFVFEWLR